MSPKLIVVDDEPALAGLIRNVAERIGFDVEQFTHGEQFRDQYKSGADIIVLDLMMPGVDGVELIRFLSDMQCSAQLILISGFDPGVLHSAQKLAMEQGLNFAGSLNKPFRHDALDRLLTRLSSAQKNLPCDASIIEPPSVDELRKALLRDEWVVHYQPKVALDGSVITAVEALVRWQHPSCGLLGPDLFIPTAEQHGLIDDLTWVVLDHAMERCRSWLDQGLKVQVAVNMSANVLKELDLPEKIGNLVKKYDLEPCQLALEVTETTLMQELTRSLDILTRLRMRGFYLSIDDFGTGYSSLVQLHRVPFSEIKIDRSFIMEMESDPEARAIVETVILLGHKLNMNIVAEGVETASCQKILHSLACNVAQGYLFARPMPGEELPAWFSRHSVVDAKFL